MKKIIVAVCLATGVAASTFAGPSLVSTNGGWYCPNNEGNLAPFCDGGCSNASPCDKKCRSDDEMNTCITCGEWGTCKPEPDPDPTPESTNDFHGQAIVTLPGCEMTVNAHYQVQSGNNFHVVLSHGECNIITQPEFPDQVVATRVTADGSFRINGEDWGIVKITPFDVGVRNQLSAAFPARAVRNLNISFFNDNVAMTVDVRFQQ